MTSGVSLAISVKLMPSASEYWAGALSEPKPAPRSSSAASFQGVEPLSLPPHSFLGTPTGTTPRAMATSSLTQDTVTTRFGCSLMVVSDRKSTRLNSSHLVISYAVFCLKKKCDRMIELYVGD